MKEGEVVDLNSAPVTVWVWSFVLASEPYPLSLPQLFLKECKRPQHYPRIVLCAQSQEWETEAGRSGIQGQPQVYIEFREVS